MAENTFKVGDRVQVTYGTTTVCATILDIHFYAEKDGVRLYHVSAVPFSRFSGWVTPLAVTAPPRNPICNLRFPAAYSRFTVTESDEPDVIRTGDGDYMDAREYRRLRRSLGLLY